MAQDKQCSSRNIRDIRSRALRQLRSKFTKHEGTGSPVLLMVVLFMLLASVFGVRLLVSHLSPLYSWVEYVGYGILAMACIPLFLRFKDREVEGLLRNHWASKNGSQRKE